jgi:DNA-binding Lrp family transcriptional regulator
VPTPAAVGEYLGGRLGRVDGIAAYRSQLRTTGYREPSSWRLHMLTPAQRGALEAAARGTTGGGGQDRRHVRTDTIDRRLFALLREDGRVPVSHAAQAAGLSEPAARRRIGRLLANQLIRPRCEVAQSISGSPVTAMLWLRAPAAVLDSAARRLATLREARMCCSLAGPRNLLLMLWLAALCLHTIRQMGHLLDSAGRSIGRADGPGHDSGHDSGHEFEQPGLGGAMGITF